MKVLRIRLENLNSLRGPLEIDLTQGSLGSTGLYAITGPTGAGKSTLLDAITLALYGKAARYGSAPNPADMMSRQAAHCLAEVDFACASGAFTASWALHRAKKRSDGKVQAAKRRVFETHTGTVVAEKVDECNASILQLTGLDYERFLRSVMLAQGDFASFIRAKSEERAALLEQVTGTTVYRDLSMAAHQRCVLAKDAIAHVEAQVAGIVVLTEAERSLRRQRQTELSSATQERNKRRSELEALLQRVRLYSRLMEEQQAQHRAMLEHQANDGAFETSRQRLKRAQQAQSLRGVREAVQRSKAAILENEEACAGVLREESLLADKQASLMLTVQAATEAYEKAKGAHARFKETWLEVGRLDARLQQVSETLTKRERESKDLAAQLELLRKQHQELQEAADKYKDRIATGKSLVQTHQADASLAEMLPQASELCEAWRQAHAQVVEAQRRETDNLSEQAKAAQALEQASRELSSLQAMQTAQEGLLASLDRKLLDMPEKGLLESLEARIEQVLQEREEASRIAGLAAQIENLEHKAKVHEKACLSLQEKEAALSVEIQSQENVLAQLVALEKAREQAARLAQRVADLSTHRHLLRDGQPCPLCGAREHPWATELASNEEARLAETALAEARDSLRELQKLLQKLKEEFNLCRHRQAQSLQELEQVTQELGRLRTTLGTEAVPPSAASCAERVRVVEDGLASARQNLKTCRELHSERSQLLSQSAKLQVQSATAEAAVGAAQARCQRLSEEAVRLGKQSSQAREVCLQAMQAVQALPELSDLREASEAKGRLDALKERSRKYTQYLSLLAELERQLEQNTTRTQALVEQLSGLAERHATLSQEESELRSEQAQVSQRRYELFGERPHASALGEEDARLEALRTALAASESQYALTRSKREHCREDAAKLAAARVGLKDASLKAEQTFQEACAAASFDPLAYDEALLPDTELAALEQAARELEKRAAALEGEGRRLALALAEFQTGDPAQTASAELLQQHLQLLLEEAEAAAREQGALHQALAADDAARHKMGKLSGELTELREGWQRWEALRALIGSADGSSFARFAQGLTLERLARVANRHLHQLNPRYSLGRVRSEDPKELNLEITDHYQADSVRPMGSLSGGETFLVSLALALALSELASGHASIDTLFIDEGFGSLDADTLEAAMSALEALQARGKKIGVISHVQAMQERIAVQIRVEKQSGGLSRVLVDGSAN